MQRRLYRSVPSYPDVSWLFSDAQAALFDGWIKHAIGYSDWFLMPLRTPLGLAPAKVRFTDKFISGKEIVGVNHWRWTATIEAFELPVITEAELTALLAGMDLSVMNARLLALLKRWYTKSWPGAV
jgi:hypothetical protein